MTQPPNQPNGQPFDPNQIPSDPQQAAAWAQQQQAAAWQQQQQAAAAWQQQAAQEQQYQAQQEYLEQQAAEAKKPAFGGVKGIISAIVIVVVVGVGGWSIWQQFQSSQALQPGKCVVLSGTSDDADHKEVNCEANDYSWKVASVVDSDSACPKDDTVSYTITKSSRRGGSSRTVKVACLSPNFKEGQCYAKASSDINEFKLGTCATGEIKISKVIEDGAATCEVPEQTVNYPTMKRTYCAEPVA